jgi:hypothetical protein
MKKIVILIVIVCLANGFYSCKDKHQDYICGVKDPVTELEWLKEWIKKAEINENHYYDLSVIYLETFNSQPVFYIYISASSCLFCEVYYCDGTKVKFTTESLTEFSNNLKKDKIIWKKL